MPIPNFFFFLSTYFYFGYFIFFRLHFIFKISLASGFLNLESRFGTRHTPSLAPGRRLIGITALFLVWRPLSCDITTNKSTIRNSQPQNKNPNFVISFYLFHLIGFFFFCVFHSFLFFLLRKRQMHSTTRGSLREGNKKLFLLFIKKKPKHNGHIY